METTETNSFTKSQKVLATSFRRAGAETTSEIQLRILSEKERMRRALKAFGIVYGITFCCVFLPIVHFVLVPLGLILGPVFFVIIHRISTVVIPTDIVCPYCQAKISIVQQQAKWPLKEYCGQCQSEITVTPSK